MIDEEYENDMEELVPFKLLNIGSFFVLFYVIDLSVSLF